MKNKDLIYSVKDLFNKYLEKDERFVIPEYQRGYKWPKRAIRNLLDDIFSFQIGEDDKRFYCLQNITLVKNAHDNCVNVVDGQQRLTTLLVILSYLYHRNETIVDLDNIIKNINSRIDYKVRPITNDFILNILIGSPNLILNNDKWSSFIQINKKYDYQDVYYLFSAYLTVREWFGEHDDGIIESYVDKLLNHVKFIVNCPKISPQEEHELFGNLNTGKVNLDGCDLVRALLITYVADEETNEIVDEPKRLVELEEKRVRIGLLLDKYAQWWSQRDVIEYYSLLLPVDRNSNDENIKFDATLYPIDRLYQLYFIKKKSEIAPVTLDFFEHINELDINYTQMFKEMQQLQRLLEYWYDDITLYHLIPYVIRFGWNPNDPKRTVSIVDLFNKWRDTCYRDFVEYLKDCIRCKYRKDVEDSKDIDDNKAYNMNDIKNLSVNWFSDYKENHRLHETFILLDIIDILSSQNANAMPFLKPSYFCFSEGDIEHIFPQTLISRGQKNKTSLFMEYQKAYNNMVENWNNNNQTLSPKVKLIYQASDFDWSGNEDEAWEKVNELTSKIHELFNINHIGNLCLLLLSVNREYGNDFFDAKRLTILHRMRTGFDENDKPCFIRPHVLDAFDKAFYKKDETIDMHNWDINDVKKRAEFIYDQINDFLK